MRILLDATSGARPEKSGVGRYVHELIAAISRIAGDHSLCLGVRWSRFRARRFLPNRQDGRPQDFRLICEGLDWLRSHPFDIAHGLDARPIRIRGPRMLVTIHDIFSLEFEDLAGPRFRSKKLRRYREIADHADRVICVSEATRHRFVAAFPDAASRAVVIPLGVSSDFAPCDDAGVRRVLAHHQIVRPYFLHIGLLNSRKNLPTLLLAFDQVARRHDEVELVLAGRKSHGFEDIARTLQGLEHRARVRLLDFVPSGQLSALYTGAVALVFPTRAEGFGLPVLEALACGAPVIATDLEVIREVAGTHFSPVTASDSLAFAAAMEDALGRPSTEGERAARVEWASRFTWDRAASRTLEEYRTCLGTALTARS